jgi:O-antigen ligase
MVLSVVVLIVNAVSIGHYLHQKAYFDSMLLQSKSIPIPGFRHVLFDTQHNSDLCTKGGMHHIHFGVLNALVLLALVGLLVKRRLEGFNKWLGVICVIGIAISFHVLSSRTGIVSLYLGALLTIAVIAFKHGSIKLIIIGIMAVLVMLLAAYTLSSSFRNKVENSAEDIQSLRGKEDINYKSMAMRMEAYKTSWYILKKNPFGVGAAAQNEAMQKAYEARNSVLFLDNRVGPHNQLLEFGVKFGWLGIILLLAYLILLLRLVISTEFAFLAILFTVLIALQFESLFERQASIYFLSLIIPVTYHLFVTNEINASPLEDKT